MTTSSTQDLLTRVLASLKHLHTLHGPCDDSPSGDGKTCPHAALIAELESALYVKPSPLSDPIRDALQDIVDNPDMADGEEPRRLIAAARRALSSMEDADPPFQAAVVRAGKSLPNCDPNDDEVPEFRNPKHP